MITKLLSFLVICTIFLFKSIAALSFNRQEYDNCMKAPNMNDFHRYIPYYTKWDGSECSVEMFGAEETVISSSRNSRITKHTHLSSGISVILKAVRMTESKVDAIRSEECLLANILIDETLEQRIAPKFYCTMNLALNAYLVMEYIECVDLLKLKMNNLSSQYLIPVLETVGYFIDWLHGEGLIHHDIKSENILVDSKGQIRLVDYGYAGPSTEPFFAKLSPFYAAPEMIAASFGGKKPATFDKWESLDWYALGITAFEICETDRLIPPAFDNRNTALSFLKKGIDPQFLVGREDRTELYCGLLKFNPSERWNFAEIKAWIMEHNASKIVIADSVGAECDS